MLYEYGCGQEARYFSKTGKACCSESYSKCPEVGKRRWENRPRSIKNQPKNLVGEICHYCGEPAKFYNWQGFCCSKTLQQCPKYSRDLFIKRGLSEIEAEEKVTRHQTYLKMKQEENPICKCGEPAKFLIYSGYTLVWCCAKTLSKCPKYYIERYSKTLGEERALEKFESSKNYLKEDPKCYGCGEPAKFFMKVSKKWWCVENPVYCPAQKFKLRTTTNGKEYAKAKEEEIKYLESKRYLENPICEYGCGKPGKFFLETPHKWCCEEKVSSCEEIKNKVRKTNKGFPLKLKENDRLCNYGCGKIAKFQVASNSFCCSYSNQLCDVIRSQSNETRIISLEQAIPKNHLCDYGCGGIANFAVGKNLFCCCSCISNCPSNTTKTINSSLRFNRFYLPSGKYTLIRGWEGYFALEILKSGSIKEEEILFETSKGLPRIHYLDPLDKKVKTHLPDLFIPRLNQIFEIKSKWTLRSSSPGVFEINLAKREAAILSGFNYRIVMIVDPKIKEYQKYFGIEKLGFIDKLG